jgi:signal transduction histidine kinase
MSAAFVHPVLRVRPSVSRLDLIPELGIAVAAVSLTGAVHLIALRLGQNPLFLFLLTAAALTFWRGLGPGMLASSLGSSVGPVLYSPFSPVAPGRENLPVEFLLMFAGSMFTCWLIYRLRVDQEKTQAVQDRRNDGLAFVSHELRQPLSNIKLAVAVLERDGSEETVKRATTLIMRSSARLGAVIDDLTDLTQLQADALRVERTAMPLQDSILAAIEGARPAIEQKQQYLQIDVPRDPPIWVSGDAMRLEQVLGNLLSNASKYSPEGAEIRVSACEESGRAVVAVRDSGMGIRRDMLETIFDPFIRDSTGGAGGLGVGLTLARNLVRQHGGRITAQSEGPGRGSTFVVELPPLSAAPSTGHSIGVDPA